VPESLRETITIAIKTCACKGQQCRDEIISR
jgi:hypothetical protein